MPQYEDFFKGKRITLLGLGLLGRGVGDAEFLAQCGAQVLVTDLKTASELSESVDRLKKYPNITFHLGGHNVVDFTQCDMVLKAAGVPLNSPEIAAARASNIPVYMSTALFAKFAMEAGIKIVGVTGTRGKSTVTHMIHHTLISARGSDELAWTERGYNNVYLGGNIRGISTLAMLPEIKSGDVVILELDSWQLQGFGDLQISPNVAIFTNLMPDHLNYYADDTERYFLDKANIFKYQKENDVLIARKKMEDRMRAVRPGLRLGLITPLPEDWHLSIPGEHNRENAEFAAEALRSLGLHEREIQKGIESFEGVEGRLQLVAEKNGVKIYNDNNATTPEATIAALRAFDTNIILIAGGADKGLDTSFLATEIINRCKKVILLTGTGTEKLKKEIPDAQVFDSLTAAFDAARRAARTGDTILFSPAFASFGMFKNEYDRNDRFLKLVEEI